MVWIYVLLAGGDVLPWFQLVVLSWQFAVLLFRNSECHPDSYRELIYFLLQTSDLRPLTSLLLSVFPTSRLPGFSSSLPYYSRSYSFRNASSRVWFNTWYLLYIMV